jgi:glucose/arabinose dehydrogenase
MRVTLIVPALAMSLAIVGCADASSTPSRQAASQGSSLASSSTSTAATASGSASPRAKVSVDAVVTTNLTSPWGLAFLPDGSALVSERDTGRIKRVPAGGGNAVTVGRVSGVQPTGEAGLLGLAVPPGDDPNFVFAYYTAARDNRVVKIAWDGQKLGKQTAILTGIPKAAIHDGGRLLIGPDDTVFVATGEVGNPSLAQQKSSLAGKVLRVTFDGKPAPGNPFPGSPVYTLGHRNVQGLALDSQGRVWASEFGQNDVDELNLLTPGANYGWPIHEGAGNDRDYVDPFVQWSPTSTASPSGIAIVDDVAYVASLRGQTLWKVRLSDAKEGKATRVRIGDKGRLRTVAAAPDGSLWLVTSNTDGRGSPRAKDDRILRLTIG